MPDFCTCCGYFARQLATRLVVKAVVVGGARRSTAKYAVEIVKARVQCQYFCIILNRVNIKKLVGC